MAELKLSVAFDDYTVQKVKLVAAKAGVGLAVAKVTPEALAALHAEAKSMVLTPASGPAITQHLAILRYLAQAAPAAELAGSNSLDAAQVDQWLHFSWHEVGACIVGAVSYRRFY